MLKRNLIANFLGQSWVALMGLAFIPLYIKYLGIEAYGLIGLFALLSAWLGLLDMGMTPTLGREMARFTGGSRDDQSIRDLLRTIEIIAFSIALIIAALIAFSSNWLATSWLNSEVLPVDVVAQAFIVMGVVTALRFSENIYRSSILGLQRQVLFNVVNSIMATVRGLGAVAVLAWFSATIKAFFFWQAFVSFTTLIILAVVTYGTLPKGNRVARFSIKLLRDIWKFAGGMLGIALLALILTQVDKILLSRLLTLSEFGYYTLAATVAGVFYMLVTPITQAIYPKLCELHSGNDYDALAKTYHRGSQLVSVIAGSVAIVMIFFSETFLHLWTQDENLARQTGPLLSLLMLGNLLNGIMNMPYQLQLAYGWTSLSVKVNIAAVLIIVPAILWATPRYGAEGAAWAWVSLNTGYVLIAVHLMYRRILKSEKWQWYLKDVLAPLGASTIVVLLIKLAWPATVSLIFSFFLLAFAFLSAIFSSASFANLVREQIIQYIYSRLRLRNV